MRSDIIDSMKARGHVSFKVMDVARTVIMERESNKARTRKGFSRRFVHIFDPQFGVEFAQMFNSEGSIRVESFEEYFQPKLLHYNIKDSNMLMVPVLHNTHWWCCVFNLRDRRIDILDSMESFYAANQLQEFVLSLRFLWYFCDKIYGVLGWSHDIFIFKGTTLLSFGASPQIFPTAVVNFTWAEAFKAENNALLYINRCDNFPKSLAHGHIGRSRFQILQEPNTTLLLEASVSQPLGPNFVSRNSGSKLI
ncbi:hypothetical protein F0562_028076 [Nyssa sinensis]|uniref:Ubiquitin-like protease family profile domain-containing protein n=1 Tax=Nyssa sinensis TaxID=561372 RepID=A0A5J5B6W4_9ASTE|nr:hypothetical protein F0562_028076 [Nyssa sinensis]